MDDCVLRKLRKTYKGLEQRGSMDRLDIEQYLISAGWRDEGYGIFEKEPVPLRRVKMLKTSIRFEVRGIGKWINQKTVHYKDIVIDSGGLMSMFSSDKP